MKIRNLKIKLIGPTLLLIPMACMHLGEGHHNGDHHSMSPYPSFRSSTHSPAPAGMTGVEGMTIPKSVKDKG